MDAKGARGWAQVQDAKGARGWAQVQVCDGMQGGSRVEAAAAAHRLEHLTQRRVAVGHMALRLIGGKRHEHLSRGRAQSGVHGVVSTEWYME